MKNATNLLTLTPTLDLIVSFSKIKGARLFAINGYESGSTNKKCITTELANHVVNLNVNYEGAQIKDIITLREMDVTTFDLKGKGKKGTDIDFKTAELARMELLASLLKLSVGRTIEKEVYTAEMLNNELAELVYEYSDEVAEMDKVFAVLTRSNKYRSDAQKDIYQHICNGVKVYVGEKEELKGSIKIFAFALADRKVVTRKGVYEKTDSASKTLAKNIFKATLKATKYKTFTITNIEGNVKVNGDELKFDYA